MRSFSKYATNDSKLLIKQHPLDEIHNNYHSFIKRCCQKYKISKERVLYVTDIHLPSVFQKSIGTITINSTAGMSSLHHNTPTICLTDKCIYNIESITYQGKLNNFWSEAGTFKIDRKVFSNFNKYIDQHTQIVGSGYWGKFELNRMEELIEVKDD